MVSVSLWLILPNGSLTFKSLFLSGNQPSGVILLNSLYPFGMYLGKHAVHPPVITCRAALRCYREEGRLSSATWKDVCTLDDTGFGELESVSSHSLLVSALPLAASCGCSLPPLFLLDQDETEWDSALFLLHLPHHTPTLDVGLPISIILSDPAVVFKGWRKRVSH